METIAKTWTVPLFVLLLALWVPKLLHQQDKCQQQIAILNSKGESLQSYVANSGSIKPVSDGLTFTEAGTGKTMTLQQVSYTIAPCQKQDQ